MAFAVLVPNLLLQVPSLSTVSMMEKPTPGAQSR